MNKFSLITLLVAARARARREDGAVALATLAFMIVLGLVSIITLWSIAYATGAYNSLYAATQSAAYAAVGQTVPATPNSSQGQLDFNCNPEPNAGTGGNPVCDGGNVMAIVNATFTASFPAPNSGILSGFGLTWNDAQGGSVQLADANNAPISGPTYVYAYFVPDTPGAARAAWLAQGSGSCPATVTLGGLGQPQFLCWSVREQAGAYGIGGTDQFSSGVIIRTFAQIKIPGCIAFFCAQTDLHVVTAASEAQQAQ
jgi:hypothetical protein